MNAVNPAVDLKSLALGALDPIRGKLQCLRGSIPGLGEVTGEINNEMSTSSTVEALIRDATFITAGPRISRMDTTSVIVVGTYVSGHNSSTSRRNLSASFSSAMSFERHSSPCEIKAFLASSRRSVSSLSMSCVNSGFPLPVKKAELSGVLESILRRALGKCLGILRMRMFRKACWGSLKTISSYCQECTGSTRVAGVAGSAPGNASTVGTGVHG